MIRFWLLLVGTVCFFKIHALHNSKFYLALAQNGDGVYSLLRRFELDQHLCNFKQFYELNKLERNAHLVAGRQYFLPILLYDFDGKTIRSSVGVNDWDLAVKIQDYNERMLTARLRETSFKDNGELWVPFHYLNCPDAVRGAPPVSSLPAEKGEMTKGGDRNFPIFGKKYAHTPLESDKLSGKVFYIDAGHGGPDPGAMMRRGGHTLCEDEYAYDVALRLCRLLIANGAIVYMVNRDANDGIRSGSYLPCDTDEVLWGNIVMMQQLKPRLFQRSNVINDLYEKHKKQGITDQKLITIHVDSRNKGQQIDLFFYHKPGDETSRQFALKLHETMRLKYKKYRRSGQYHGTVTSRDLHMLRETLPTAVYIELGNIRNSFDQQRIILESNRRALAVWLYEGLVE